ncbi:N-acetyllactosaminide beta-1,3-N-acetylglucosaminyltransferase 2-like [Amblyraja radiata]|uniref:N-acetyllactosaminide beta-1,3-N-acetylglucosaminyltransferase 2-like n=1 Tax=Amblyraja radiata TaxID=386614 RepID=UPI0014041BA1|nr:N-acetyllactosaminide beta-1,3-N-acetylglucosaminyltransferase 2-like [Amblyraja radiata]
MGFSRIQLGVLALLGFGFVNIFLNWYPGNRLQFPTRRPGTTSGYNRSLSDSGKPRNVTLLNISPSFTSFIPVKTSFWNRRLHQALQRLSELRAGGAVDFTPPRGCRPVGLEAEIANADSYSLPHRDFVRYMDCKDQRQLIDHRDKCVDSGHGVFLLLAIKSMAGNFERRQAIRETWGMETAAAGSGSQIRTVFLLGSADDLGQGPDLQPLVNVEDQMHGDILQWDFRDSLYNLTLKDHLFLGWASARCPLARYVFKGDDDVFLNTPVVVEYLRSLNGSKELYVGQMIKNASPLRDTKSKYNVPLSFYDGAYPPYMGGAGFLYSGHLVPSLYAISHAIPFYPIDDVFTGMCFSALGISPINHQGFHTFDIQPQDRDNPCAHAGVLLVHQRGPSQTTRLWRALRQPDLRC